MLYTLFCDISFIRACYDNRKNYFDLELLPKVENEVFVDAGSYHGEDSISFIKIYGENYKKIYIYEPSIENMRRINENLKRYPGIKQFNKAISDKKAKCYLLLICLIQQIGFILNGVI